MVPVTRRRLLHATAGVAAALAGCGDASRDESRGPPEPPENVDRDPDGYALRNPDGEPAAWLPREDAESDGTGGDSSGTSPSGPPENARVYALVASRETADRIRYADVDGVEGAREFVAATEFDTESVYVESKRVQACYRLELCYVTWSDTEIDTQYGRHLRDADVACDADAEESTTWLVRVPDALDPDEVTGHGSGTSGRGCEPLPPPLRTTTRTTAEPMVGPATTNGTTEGDR